MKGSMTVAFGLAGYFGWALFVGIPGVFASLTHTGSMALPALVQEAMLNNIEIKEATHELESMSASKAQSRASFFPEFGVEGGWEGYKANTETLSNSFYSIFGRMNLYRGGRDYSLFNARSQEEEFLVVRLNKTKAKIERLVSEKFYELLYLQEVLSLKEEALAVNKNQMKMAEKKKIAGFTSQSDVLEFQLREVTLKSDILLLKQEEETAIRELKRLFSRTDNAPIVVMGHLNRESFHKTIDVLLRQALLEREDLKEAEKNLGVSTIEYKAILGEWLPRADLETAYGRIFRPDRVLGATPSWNIAFKVSLPFFSGLGSYYERRSKAQGVARQDLKMERLRQEIKVQVENAYIRLKTIEERLEIEEKNIEQSKKYYEITLSEYKRGVKNSPDVAGAAERFFDARLRNLQFRRNFYLTKLALAEAVGVSGSELSM